MSRSAVCYCSDILRALMVYRVNIDMKRVWSHIGQILTYKSYISHILFLYLSYIGIWSYIGHILVTYWSKSQILVIDM